MMWSDYKDKPNCK